MKQGERLQSVSPLAEYSVEFEAVSTFLAYFRDVPGLTDEEIVQRAVKIAQGALGGGSMTIERSSREGSYAFVALGVDRRSARVLGKPALPHRPALKLVK